MPFLNGTGPQGRGPMTGRGQGYCEPPASHITILPNVQGVGNIIVTVAWGVAVAGAAAGLTLLIRKIIHKEKN